MTQRKAIIVLDGNERKQEQAIHELQKFADEASREPELDATVHTERIEDTNVALDAENAFDTAQQ